MTNMHTLVDLPVRMMRAVITDPAEVWTRGVEKLCERREWQRPRCEYVVESDWEYRLHAQLGLPWPCPICAEFGEIWSRIVASLAEGGLRVGPTTFGPWNDGDAGLVRAIWCLVRHLSPERVVETGVAHGLTSRFILEGMATNGHGHLWSIDLPPLDPALRQQVGIAVTRDLKDRWTYIQGSSRRRLPALLAKLGRVDLFVHDSLHSERNVRFELDQTWAVLRDGGAVVVDDIDANWGFHSFNETFVAQPHFVCEAEPLRPDHRRFNQKGLFGIIIKSGSGTMARPSRAHDQNG